MRIDGNDSINGGRNNARSNATATAISSGHGTTISRGNRISEGESTTDGVWFQPVVEEMDCPDGVCPVPWTIDTSGDDVKEDLVNHPSHYNDGGLECIEAIEAQLTPEEYRGYLKGNVAKYVWREKHKGGIESLKKAQWYLTRLIAL